MKGLVFFFFVILNIIAMAQDNMPTDKFIRRSTPSDSMIHKLDSLYLSAMGNDTSECAFPNNQDSVMNCLKRLIENMDEELKKNNFKWHSEPQLHIRSYFNENGYIDYFAYSIKDTTFTRYDEFENALKDFVSSYNFGLKCDKKYAQCCTINL